MDYDPFGANSFEKMPLPWLEASDSQLKRNRDPDSLHPLVSFNFNLNAPGIQSPETSGLHASKTEFEYPTIEELKPRELFSWGLLCHFKGEDLKFLAKRYYRAAAKAGYSQAINYERWIDEKVEIDYPVHPGEINDQEAVSRFLAHLHINPILSGPSERGLELLTEAASCTVFETGNLWHSIKMLWDLHRLGRTFDELSASVSRVGVIHNVLNPRGIPIPGMLRGRNVEEEGWDTCEGVRFSRGEAEIVGKISDTIAPILTKDDIDVALWLSFLESDTPVLPSFSLEGIRSPDILHMRLDRKIFEPEWLGHTGFGQSLYFADWIMKAMTMLDGLPSVTNPFCSAASDEKWKPTAMMKAIESAKENETSNPLQSISRLQIYLRELSLNKGAHRKWNFRRIHEYQIVHQDLTILSGEYSFDGGGNKIHNVKEQQSTVAKILSDNYDYLSDHFPVFDRVKMLLSVATMFSQARRDGIQLSRSEQKRLKQKIGDKRDGWLQGNSTLELSPKPYHNRGCYCQGGVGASHVVRVADAKKVPLLWGPNKAHYVVSSSGFVTPIQTGAFGPIPTRGDGMRFAGGGGGHGFVDKVTQTYIMQANKHDTARSYYRNSTGQKIDPFTGKTVQPNNWYAHMYHDKES